ncbi:UNVERIFIED_CONTAM: hypothetical protein FKN15_017569 [Acipenser sinensis]
MAATVVRCCGELLRRSCRLTGKIIPSPVYLRAEVVQKVNSLVAAGQYGRLFAVVHFASRQWKVTNEDLILIENHIDAECGERIRMEKVLLVAGADFTLIGKPLLGRDLVRVEATVIEKTESWPKVHMRFWKRHRYQRKRTMTVRFITKRFIGEYDPTLGRYLKKNKQPVGLYRKEAFLLMINVKMNVVGFEKLTRRAKGYFKTVLYQEEDALLIEEKIKWGDGFVIVYSVTDRCSFDEVMRLCFLVNHIHSNSRKGSSDPPPIVIVANKRDLEFDRMVTTEDGENLSKALKHPFCEVSTRDSYEETVVVFHTLYSEMMKQLSSSPTSFRRRAVSKLMDKIPKIHANSTLGSTGRSFSFNSFRDLLPE